MTDRAFTSPLWKAEAEIRSAILGYEGHWRIGSSLGNRAGAGGYRGLHLSVDQDLTPAGGVFGRYGVASQGMGSLAFGPVRQSYSGGINLRVNSASRWSAGFAQTFEIDHLQTLTSERLIESYYRWQWTENLSVTPDFQFILGSGGRLIQGTQAVSGLRLSFAY